jgi:hypothetical protein
MVGVISTGLTVRMSVLGMIEVMGSLASVA